MLHTRECLRERPGGAGDAAASSERVPHMTDLGGTALRKVRGAARSTHPVLLWAEWDLIFQASVKQRCRTAEGDAAVQAAQIHIEGSFADAVQVLRGLNRKRGPLRTIARRRETRRATLHARRAGSRCSRERAVDGRGSGRIKRQSLGRTLTNQDAEAHGNGDHGSLARRRAGVLPVRAGPGNAPRRARRRQRPCAGCRPAAPIVNEALRAGLGPDRRVRGHGHGRGCGRDRRVPVGDPIPASAQARGPSRPGRALHPFWGAPLGVLRLRDRPLGLGDLPLPRHGTICAQRRSGVPPSPPRSTKTT